VVVQDRTGPLPLLQHDTSFPLARSLVSSSSGSPWIKSEASYPERRVQFVEENPKANFQLIPDNLHSLPHEYPPKKQGGNDMDLLNSKKLDHGQKREQIICKEKDLRSLDPICAQIFCQKKRGTSGIQL
jgi:hypothetical protein